MQSILLNINDIQSNIIVYGILYSHIALHEYICISIYAKHYVYRIQYTKLYACHCMLLYTINSKVLHSIIYTEYSMQNIICIIFYA